MKVKKSLLKIICMTFAILFAIASVPVYAFASEKEGYSWYCVHVKDHRRPSLDPRLSFIENYNAVYLDPNVSETSEEKVVYLTFDAGYENGNVSKILDVLKEENVPGTFFILQNLIRKNPELVKRMVEEGHLVGNHTAHHKNMSYASDEALINEIKLLEDKYQELIGQEMPKFYRPPEGRFSEENLKCLTENGYQTVFWSFAYPDWDNNRQMPEKKAEKIILDNLHNGSILLLHPTSATNAAILGNVIREIKNQGYKFGRIDEIAYQKIEKIDEQVKK
ncbi:MAG: delta-lactam-biosynthetic de-N-acetylase [Ruminococcaceae bacterium]|nr:delta-lactam-biosynthetic de-N-acetylase [Oscillospiraceae bacterium]